MSFPSPASDGTVVILSGAGLSVASGIPTFRDANGLWEGHEVTEVATPEAWFRNRELVRRFYNERRVACAKVKPNAGHQALAELQRRWGAHRVGLITQNIDGLLTQAQAPRVIEMHGSLWQLRCENDPDHPRFEVAGNQDPGARCRACEGLLRPDVVWFGEMPYAMDRIEEQMGRCTTFISVGTSGVVYPAAGLGTAAWRAGALCLEVNPKPCGGAFHHVFPEDSASLLPRLVRSWLDD